MAVLRGVAKKAGVSIATVLRLNNGHQTVLVTIKSCEY